MIGERPGPQTEIGDALWLRSDLIFRPVQDDYVLVDLREGVVYRPNATGVHLLTLLANGALREQLVESVVAHFDVDGEQAARDVDDFVQRWASDRGVPGVEG